MKYYKYLHNNELLAVTDDEDISKILPSNISFIKIEISEEEFNKLFEELVLENEEDVRRN